jgi:adenylate cyclase
MSHRLPVSLYCICFGIGFLGIFGSLLPIFTVAEDNLGLHLLYLWRGPEKPHADVVVVAIDREAAKALQLPAAAHKWPRMLHARLLKRLTAAGAGVVVFDLNFHESQTIDDDQAFGAAIAEAGNVILTQPIDRQTMPFTDATGTRGSWVNIEKMVSAIPVIADAALAQAPFPLPKTSIKLNQFWRFSPGSGDIPTLPVVAMHVYAMSAFEEFLVLLEKVDPAAASLLPMRMDRKSRAPQIMDAVRLLYTLFEQDPSLNRRMIDELERHPPTTPLVRALLELYSPGQSRYLNLYGPPRTIETISYHRLLDSNDETSGPAGKAIPSLKGKAVFVGQTESDWFKANDGFYTVFTDSSGMDISGVEIAATAFANLSESKAVHPLLPEANLAVLFGWGVTAALISLHFSTTVSTAGLLLLNASYMGLAYVQFKSRGIWFPLVMPVLVQTPVAYMAGLVWKYRKVNMERRNIREAFGRYLPDHVVNQLASNTKSLGTGGKMLYSICLFTDAESYTSLSEELDPEQLTRLMNTYYEAIFKPIKAHGGIVLQVIGDSVLAIWTAAQQSDALKDAAFRAAVGIAAAVHQFNAQAGAYLLPTRIGIHAGDILLGNIGAMDHFEYRPVGDIVNTASRLEGLNKHLGTRMLTSEDALGTDGDAVTRPVGQFVFKGKSRPVRVHEILQSRSGSERSRAEVDSTFARGLEAFQRQQWDRAAQYFGQVLQLDGHDGPSKFYRKLCLELREAPPHSDWNGAVHLTRK